MFREKKTYEISQISVCLLFAIHLHFTDISPNCVSRFARIIFCGKAQNPRIRETSPLPNIWDKVFKSGLSKFCGRQPLKKEKTVFHKIYLVHS